MEAFLSSSLAFLCPAANIAILFCSFQCYFLSNWEIPRKCDKPLIRKLLALHSVPYDAKRTPPIQVVAINTSILEQKLWLLEIRCSKGWDVFSFFHVMCLKIISFFEKGSRCFTKKRKKMEKKSLKRKSGTKIGLAIENILTCLKAEHQCCRKNRTFIP